MNRIGKVYCSRCLKEINCILICDRREIFSRIDIEEDERYADDYGFKAEGVYKSEGVDSVALTRIFKCPECEKELGSYDENPTDVEDFTFGELFEDLDIWIGDICDECDNMTKYCKECDVWHHLATFEIEHGDMANTQ